MLTVDGNTLKNQSYTENKQMIMSKDKDRRCGQVAEFFRLFLKKTDDWCVVRSEQFGYIVLSYYLNGRFVDNNVFRMFGDDVATYTMDTKEKNVDMKYAQAYGGQTTHMSYVIDGDTLTLTDRDTGDVHVYKKTQ